MALIKRIADLIKANINDLIDRAEDPEKTINQVIVDMEEDLKKLKSRLAVSISDRRLLERSAKENRDAMGEWMGRAERAVEKGDELLARTALDGYIGFQELAESFEEQCSEQDRHVEELKALLQQLEQKLTEARSTGELLTARRRRARTLRSIGCGSLNAEDLSGKRSNRADAAESGSL